MVVAAPRLALEVLERGRAEDIDALEDELATTLGRTRRGADNVRSLTDTDLGRRRPSTDETSRLHRARRSRGSSG
jgi:hypothetical protein